jgi:hypothetical protein
MTKIIRQTKNYSDAELKLIQRVQIFTFQNSGEIACFGIRNGKISVHSQKEHPIWGDKIPLPSPLFAKTNLIEDLYKHGLNNFEFTALADGRVYE